MRPHRTMEEFWNDFIDSCPTEVTDCVSREFLRMAFYAGVIVVAFGAEAMLRDGTDQTWLKKTLAEIDEYRADVAEARRKAHS